LSPYFRGDIRAASHFRASIRNLERHQFRIHPDIAGSGSVTASALLSSEISMISSARWVARASIARAYRQSVSDLAHGAGYPLTLTCQ
jgi:hypothetical protein